MTASLSPSPKLQFFDANGNPLVGGKVYAFAAGTTTPLDTYTDSTGTTPAAHPLTLNSRGECEVWLGSGAYKLELRTAAGVVVWTVDNVNTANLSSLTLGTPLAATSGGTGQSAFVVGDLLYATSTTALGRLPAAVANNVLRSAGTGTLPVWGKVVLTTDVSGTLPVANGGTGLSAPGISGNVLYSNGSVWQSVALSTLVPDATDSVKGVVELATDAEVQAGTDATRAITPDALRKKALVLETKQTLTAVTTARFVGIPSWAKRVTILFDRVSSSGTDLLTAKIFTASSVAASAYRSCAMNGSATGVNFETSVGLFILEPTNAAGAGVERCGSMVLETVDGNTWVYRANIYSDSKAVVNSSAGQATLGAALGEVEIGWTGSDQFDAPSVINIMYE
jgi:hypothetical protein